MKITRAGRARELKERTQDACAPLPYGGRGALLKRSAPLNSLLLFERLFERGLEGFVGDVGRALAVDEEGRRAADAYALAVVHVALNLVGELARVERRVELRHVEPEHLRVLLELRRLKLRL